MSSQNEQEAGCKTAFPNGHFYSPVVDTGTLLDRMDEIWPAVPEMKGIDFNNASHEFILENVFPKFIGEYQYVEKQEDAGSDCEFYTQNSQFSWLDSRALFVLLNEWKPRKVIEVGSGFSSLLTAHVNTTLLGNSMDFRCIEPYPREFLKKKIPGLNEVVVQKVEHVPLSFFEGLESGDILFIDSSHVAKTGSDVNYLMFEILPRLRKGVKIHIHDIFFPHEYPREWVMDENRSWNEQYVVRALLMYSTTFKVVFGCSYAQARYPGLVADGLNLPGKMGFGGSSLWIEKDS